MKENDSDDGGSLRLVGADRVLSVLVALAEFASGVSLDELSQRTGHAKPTVHRALASLKRAGFAMQDARGHYILGNEFLRLAFTHHEARPERVRIRPLLERLSERFGETVHYAVLEGTEVVYRDKVDPSVGAVRLTSHVGGRNPAHSTGVGKALLASRLLTLEQVEEWVDGRELEKRTARTADTPQELLERLRRTCELGFAVDDQENETGVNCVAIPVYLTSPSEASGAVSISGLAYRTPLTDLTDAIDEIHEIIAEELGLSGRRS